MSRRIAVGIIAAVGVAIMVLAFYVLLATGAFKWSSDTPASTTTLAQNKVTGTGTGDSAAAAVEHAFLTNEASADSAPKQQVVAGWATKDALEAQLRQTDTLISQNTALGQQLADDTNLTGTMNASLTALISESVIVLVLLIAAVCVLLLGIAVALVWAPEGARGPNPQLRT